MGGPEELQRKIEGCRICVDRPLGAALPHAPNPIARLSASARICIASQAPGMRAHQSSIPFNDPSGNRLREWMGVGRDVFYDTSRIAIVPMGFCFPGYDANKGDLPPRLECAAHWHDKVFGQLPQIELLLIIGQYSQAYHLGSLRSRTLTETVRNWRTYFGSNEGPRKLVLPHPSWRNTAWLKRNPWFESEILPVLRQEVARLTA